MAALGSFSDGVFNVVHGDKEVVDAILTHPGIKSVSFVGSTPIAKYVYETGTKSGKRVQALGGADAIENAIRMARLHTNKHKVLSTYRSYHGNTGSAINATGDPRRFPNEFSFGHVHFWGPYLYRSAFQDPTWHLLLRCCMVGISEFC